MSIFDYERPVLPEDCYHAISPSQLGKFFSHPDEWYLNNFTDEGNKFKGNTASFIGTICHYIYEQNTLGNKPTREEINNDLLEYLSNNPNPDVSYNDVITTYPDVATVVMNEYVIPHNSTGVKIECEKKVLVPFVDDIYIAGTCDRIEGSTLVDYKTVSTKPSGIPYNYKIQLLTYVYALRKLGYYIDTIRLVYGVKPTKTLPARCITVSEPIDYTNEKLMNDTLNLVADSIKLVRDNPELAYIVYKSYDLRGRNVSV